MVFSISKFLTNLNFFEFNQILFDKSYYEVLFPFLLIFAVFYTVLSKVKIFQNKSGIPYNSIISTISFLVSFYGVSFETSKGYSVGKLMMMMFPNISALTIGILALYIIGAVLGKDYFRDLFRKDHSSFIYMVAGGIGLGAIVFYVGTAMGFWSYASIDSSSYWNFIIAIFLLILGITFLIIGNFAIGVLFLFVFIAYVLNSGQGNILEYFIDPVIFITMLIIVLMSWLNSNSNEKEQLAKDIRDGHNSREEYRKEYGGDYPKPYKSRIFDITDTNYHKNIKKWENKYPNEKWEDFA